MSFIRKCWPRRGQLQPQVRPKVHCALEQSLSLELRADRRIMIYLQARPRLAVTAINCSARPTRIQDRSASKDIWKSEHRRCMEDCTGWKSICFPAATGRRCRCRSRNTPITKRMWPRRRLPAGNIWYTAGVSAIRCRRCRFRCWQTTERCWTWEPVSASPMTASPPTMKRTMPGRRRR